MVLLRHGRIPLVVATLVLPLLASANPFPHLYHPCPSQAVCPNAACVVNSAADDTPQCVEPGSIDLNPIGVSFNLGRIAVRGVTITNSTINATHFFSTPSRRSNMSLEYVNVAGVPKLNTIIVRFVDVSHTNVETWVAPSVENLLLFNCSLVSFPNLTNWPKLNYLDLSNNTEQFRNKLELDQGGEIAARFPFLLQLGGIGLSAMALRTIPKFIFKLPKLTRIFLRQNRFNVISLTLPEYQFLTKPGMDLHIHTFHNTPGRDNGEWSGESLPRCPDAHTITILYNSTKGNNWFVCLQDTDSATQVASIVLAWIILSGMGAAVLYLVAMKLINRHRRRLRSQYLDSDPVLATAPRFHVPILRFRDFFPAFSTQHTMMTIPQSNRPIESHVATTTDESSTSQLEGWLRQCNPSLHQHAIDSTAIELKTRVYHSKHDTIWTDSVSAADVTEIWKGSYGTQPVLIKRVSGSELALRVFARQVERLVRFQHPRITALVGVTWQVQSLALVCADDELVVDLKQCIPHIPTAEVQGQVASHIAAGLRYLHSMPQVHGNLSSSSVVVDAAFSGYLNRLDLVPCDVSKLGMAHQTLYIAPEVLSGGPHTVAADVYSFGILLAELDTGESVYHFLNRTARCIPGRHDMTVTQLLPLRQVLTFNRGPLQPAIVMCLQDDPRSRPPVSYLMNLSS